MLARRGSSGARRAVSARIHGLFRSPGGVPKRTVEGASARVTVDGVEGDWQLDRKHHGGPDRALCLFSLELIEALRAEGHPIAPGALGENLTLAGLDWPAVMLSGTRLRLGADVRVELTRPAPPCKTIAHCFVGSEFKRVSEKLHPGWSRMYARVLSEGVVHVGDAVEVEFVGDGTAVGEED